MSAARTARPRLDEGAMPYTDLSALSGTSRTSSAGARTVDLTPVVLAEELGAPRAGSPRRAAHAWSRSQEQGATRRRRSGDEGRVGLVGAGQGAGEVGAQAAAEHLVLSGGLDVAERPQQRAGAVGGRAAAEAVGGGAHVDGGVGAVLCGEEGAGLERPVDGLAGFGPGPALVGAGEQPGPAPTPTPTSYPTRPGGLMLLAARRVFTGLTDVGSWRSWSRGPTAQEFIERRARLAPGWAGGLDHVGPRHRRGIRRRLRGEVR